MKQLILIVVILMFFSSCKHENKSNVHVDKDSYFEFSDSVEREKIIIFKNLELTDWIRGNNLSFFKGDFYLLDSISNNDIVKCEYLVRTAVNEYNNSEAIDEFEIYKENKIHGKADWKLDEFQIGIEDYYRQYILINYENEFYVYINCFHKSFMENKFKKEIVDVDGGGLYFFDLVANIDKIEYSNFYVHSPI